MIDAVWIMVGDVGKDMGGSCWWDEGVLPIHHSPWLSECPLSPATGRLQYILTITGNMSYGNQRRRGSTGERDEAD